MKLVSPLLALTSDLATSPTLKPVALTAVLGWALVELVFWAYVRCYLAPRLNLRTPPSPRLQTDDAPITLLLRLMASIHDHYSGRRFISNWFGGVPVEEIGYDNVKELLAWAAFGVHLEEANEFQLRSMDENLTTMLKSLDLSLAPGYNPKIRAFRMSLEDLSFIHRPLIFYASLCVFRLLGNSLLAFCKFKRMEHQGLVYWYREGPSSSSRPPLVFFHGISVGLVSYLQFILPFASDRTALLFETPNISMSMTWQCPGKEETVEAVDAICRRHGLGNVCMVAHSFGSIITGWVASSRPWLVGQMVLVEPVSLLLCLPDTCFAFMYRQPRTLMEYIIYYFVATELSINYALKRHFTWHENICLLEELQCPVIIALSSHDAIVPTQTIRTHAEKVAGQRQEPPSSSSSAPTKAAPIEVVWWDGRFHAQCMLWLRDIWRLAHTARQQEERHRIVSQPYTSMPPAY